MQERPSLSPEEQLKIVEGYEEMFASKGWKDLTGDMKLNVMDLFPSLMQTSADEKTLNLAKGKYVVYQYLLGLEEYMSQARDMLELQMRDGEGDDLNELNAL